MPKEENTSLGLNLSRLGAKNGKNHTNLHNYGQFFHLLMLFNFYLFVLSFYQIIRVTNYNIKQNFEY